MEFLQITPQTLSFVVPNNRRAQVKLANLTLHQIAVYVVSTNPDVLVVTPQHKILDSFEQINLAVSLKYYQEGYLSNYLGARITLFCYDIDQQGDLWEYEGIQPDAFSKMHKIDIAVNCSADTDNYIIKQPVRKHNILSLKKVTGPEEVAMDFKNQIISYLETLGDLHSISTVNNCHILAKYRQIEKQISLIKEFTFQDRVHLYSISASPIILKDKPHAPENHTLSKQIKESVYEMLDSEVQSKPPSVEADKLLNNWNKEPRRQIMHTETFVIGSKFNNKATFVNKKKRRNKSVETKRVKQLSDQDEQEEEDMSKLFVPNSQIMLDHIPKSKNTTNFSVKAKEVENPKIRLDHIQTINCIDKPQGLLTGPDCYFILFQGFLVYYDSISQVTSGRKIILQTGNSDWKNWKGKLLIMKHCGQDLVFACDAYFCVVKLTTGVVDWVYVHRKEIYDVAILSSKKLIAVGGKIYSKLSYFGKSSTNRSNIKFYGLLPTHEHHLTFDINDAGDINTLSEIQTPNEKLLFAASRQDKRTQIFLIRVLDKSNVQMAARFDMEELAILHIKHIRANPDGLYLLQDLSSQGLNMCFVKRIHVQPGPGKSGVSTQVLKVKKDDHLVSSLVKSDEHYNFLEVHGDMVCLYDCKNRKITLYDYNKRKSETFVLEPHSQRVRSVCIQTPYLLVLYESFIEVKQFTLNA